MHRRRTHSTARLIVVALVATAVAVIAPAPPATAAEAAQLEIEKSATETTVTTGDTIHYEVTLTNTGDQPLTDITLTDSKAECGAAPTELAVGADPVIVDCTHVAVADDVGTYTNVATADSAQTTPLDSNAVETTVTEAPPAFEPPPLISQWGTRGTDAPFDRPDGLAIGPDGDVWVINAYAYRVEHFDDRGNFLGSFDTYIDGDRYDSLPTSLAVASDGTVYVVERGNERIHAFDPDGKRLRTFGSAGSGPGQFNGPSGIAIAADGNLYVADYDRVQVLDPMGTYLSKLQATADFYPIAPAFADDGTLYVLTYTGVRIFDAAGTEVATFGSYGYGEEQFFQPGAIAVDPSGRVYVTKFGFDSHGVLVFSADGTYQGFWAVPEPSAVAVNDDGVVYLGDHFTLVQRFGSIHELSVTTTVAEPVVAVGDTIHYEVTVRNTGTLPLTGVTLTDLLADCPTAGDVPTELAVGESAPVLACTHVTVQGDVGTYANVAIVDSAETAPWTSYPARTTVHQTGIAGTITDDATGEPVAGALAAVLRSSDFSVAASAVADAHGDYDAAVAPGTYYVYLIDPSGDHRAGFAGAPTRVTIPATGLVDVDATMATARGTLTGTVTDDATGEPIGGAWVMTVDDTGLPGTGTKAGPDGRYTITDVPAGRYYVTFIDPEGRHRVEFLGNSPGVTGADLATISAGATTAADAALTPQAERPHVGRSAQGTVTDDASQVAPGTYVIALRAADYQFVAGAVAAYNGYYYGLDLPPGDYILEFVDPAGRLSMEWYDDVARDHLADATPVTADFGITRSNAQLDLASGNVTGTITEDGSGDPIAGAWVFILGDGIVGGAVTNADGTYTVAGVRPGTYGATFVDTRGGHVQEYWEDSPVLDGSGGDTFTVPEGGATTLDAGLAVRSASGAG